MIYHSGHMTLHSVMDVFHGKVNDVVICEDIDNGSRGTYYTLLVVRDHETVRKLLRVIEQSEKDMECCVDMFSYNNNFCMVFPYVKDRKLEQFYVADLIPLSTCEEICLNLLMQCMGSTLPYPILELVIRQRQIHLLKDNSILLGYCIDLAELKEESGQKECVMECAICIRELLQGKYTKKNVSYQLLLKKIPKRSYQDFRELYKDIRLARTDIKKQGILKRLKGVWYRNKATLFRMLLYAAVIMIIVVIIMFITNLIWGDVPFLRLFTNPFKQIGTESLLK